MANSRLNVGALSVVLVLMICITFAAQTDATYSRSSCPRGYKTCRGYSKCKVNVWKSIDNCGNCGVKCRRGIPNAYPECEKGRCTFDCRRGYGDCDRNATNGCETSLNTPEHCGSCNKVCKAPDNSTATCKYGNCGFKCNELLSRCGHKCFNLQSDQFNCGRCGKVCPNKPADNGSDALIGYCYEGKCELRACFPGDATVRLEYGEVKQLTDLELGDKVAVMKPDGSIAYEDVYAFGHRDPSAVSDFVRLTLKPNLDSAETRNLELSRLHFVPVSAPAGYVVYKRAVDVNQGDKMWVQGTYPPASGSAAAVTVFVVTDISQVTKQGLYNPYTLGGTIIVNGVVASTHSDWFLDDAFKALGLNLQWLPAAYQAVLLPMRILYASLSKVLYFAVYQTWFDSDTAAAGSYVIATMAALAFLMPKVMSKY